ncbi:gas vesicle protein GvpO [Nocardia noduli]|uniref:gas vesicle protein GvpO n=1 Tax=Nocardia noduli TaxID=2815722 RepID=UPI001C22104F|nr:gas vesicle protein GvpO [Nocardia noduli]
MTNKSASDNADVSASEVQPALTASRAAAAACERLEELTSKPMQGVTCMEPTEDGWLVEIEVLEDRHIPSSADILALYEVEIDLDGNLLAYRRINRYNRSSTDIGGRGRR